ncbi:MAG: NAD(P)/FAD-dependent oxidoreductase [Rhodospirillales bacterium]|nr:NAD(P)/FAD-dependent oxidoreductase [Rhodospirillales bacterium]
MTLQSAMARYETRYDCLVVGGGPAGLSAAIYLGRFHLSVLVLDSGRSRAALIPKTRNLPGFPEGIAGTKLLNRMRRQAEAYGARIEDREVLAISSMPGGFTAETAAADFAANTILLATGVTNRRPPGMSDDLHDNALARGALRYCPVCDGFEITDKAVAIIGTGERGLNEAEFLRSYTSAVTLIAPDGAHDLDPASKARAAQSGIRLRRGPSLKFALLNNEIEITLPEGRVRFASVYPALGSETHSHLAAAIGAVVSNEGFLEVDTHQRTSVPGFYAAGDVVLGLNQISHAMGEAAVAATAIRNDLSQKSPRWR